MKKFASLLLAATAVAFASCGNNENTSTKEQIDSMATYRTDTMQRALKAQNDSLINAMAKMRADSALQAEGKVTTITTHTVTQPATRTTRSTTPVHSTSGNTNTTTNTTATPTITKDQKQQQDNKFNER